jgi:hypothetical protein
MQNSIEKDLEQMNIQLKKINQKGNPASFRKSVNFES